MASRYIIASKETAENYVLPDWAVTELGLPTSYTDKNDVEQPKQWTILTALSASSVSRAAPPFKVEVRDPLPPLREDDEGYTAYTDYVCPINNIGGNIDLLIQSLATAKPVPYHEVSLSNKQVRAWLKDGTLPVGF